MDYSDACVELTKASEGLCLTVYCDPAPGEFPTWGYGHKIKPGEDFSGCASQEKAEEVLKADLDEACASVNRLCQGIQLTQGQTDALTDFVFNVGEGNLARSTLLRYLHQGWVTEAANQLLLWTFAGGRVLPGLVRRRAAEKALFLS